MQRITLLSELSYLHVTFLVAGSISDGVIGNFHLNNSYDHTVSLELTQPLTEMSTRNISWGKGGRSIRLTTLPPSCADCHEIWERQAPGTLRACPGLQCDCFTFTRNLPRK
jgi:hypothetical protein